MAFKIRDLMISVLSPAAGGNRGCPDCSGTVFTGGCPNHTQLGCQTCTGTTGQQLYDYGCNLCTGTTAPRGCPTCSGTTGALAYGCPACTGTTADNGCPTCSGTTGYGGGCNACTGTTGGFCAHAAALAACGLCTGVSPAIGDRRPEALSLLKQQLQGLLAEVEAEEQRLADEAFPKTAEEAEALEKQLEEALAEVRSRKAGLRKG